jgi:ankyrin repeat protein
MSRTLPPRPSLRQLRQQAKDLLKAYRSESPHAISRIRNALHRLSDASDAAVVAAACSLQDMQHVLAVEYGFGTWAALARAVEQVVDDPLEAAHAAIRRGDLDSLQRLILADSGIVNRQPEKDDGTLLHTSSFSSNTEIVRFLIRSGADVLARSGEGWTPLHTAAEGDHIENVEALLEAGADVQAEACGEGGTPLAHALFSGARRTADVLATYAVTPANLRVAAGIGDMKLLRSLFRTDGMLADVAGDGRQFYRHHAEYPAWTPSDDPQEILDEAFVYACLNGRREAVEFLLEKGADIDAVPYSISGAHAAVQRGDLALVLSLVERGVDLTVVDRMHGATPQGWAHALGQKEIDDALNRLNPGLGLPTESEGAPTLFDLIDAGLEEAVAAALEEGTDPNATRLYDVPISGKGLTSMVQTALQAAISGGRRAIGERLAEAGADVDLHDAAFLGRLGDVTQLLADGDVDARDAFGRSALHCAILGGDVKAAAFLLDRGADVNAHADTYTFGARAIHVAASAGAPLEVIDLLIAAGADVNQKINPGTPVEVALRHGRPRMAEALRSKGASG